MKTLGVNTIRVYTVDGSRSHDGCMQAFDAQGIYVWLELSTVLHAFNRVSWVHFQARNEVRLTDMTDITELDH